MKVKLFPDFAGVDEGDGGIRRVYEGMRKSMPRLRVDFVDDPGDADIIACHATVPEDWVKKFPDKPIVVHCHGLYWSEYEWQDWSYKANSEVMRAIRIADAVTAPTEWVANIISRHTSRRVTVVPHGIRTRDWTPLNTLSPELTAALGQNPPKAGEYVLWNKTRPDPVCDPGPMLDLASILPARFVSTFGQSPELPGGESRGLSNVTITGRLPYELSRDLLRAAGVYLCTTRETFGIGTLEALAAGVPVVGYNYGGQAEICTHGVDSYLVLPGDIAGLAKGVEWAARNREQVSAAAREKAARYTWESAVKQYHKLYMGLAEGALAESTKPRTSIIVTAYNLEKYLPDTLASVEAQDDGDFECIIVDDASPDGCGRIADEWAAKDPHFRVIHNPTNLYLAGARNAGIEQARGRYIMALDADDMLPPHAVRVLADELDNDRGLDIAYGSVMFLKEDGVTPENYGGQRPGHSQWPVPFNPVAQTQGFNLLPYSSMFRRRAWEEVGGYRERLKTSEDADFWTRLASYGYVGRMVTDADTLIYRNREGSMSREMADKRYDYVRWYPWSQVASLAPAGLSGTKHVSLFEPIVSVVIPCGPGHELLVRDAVDSVQSQSLPNWECIVVNDSGSPLHLPAWVRVVESGHRDPAEARNLGISHARAPLYLPLDADDMLQPDALQWLVTAWTGLKNPTAIVYPDFWEDVRGPWEVYELPDWSCEDLLHSGTIHTVTALTPVEVWRTVNGYRPGAGWEDWDFQLRCAEAGFCSHHLRAPLFSYRKHTGRRASAMYDEPEYERRKAQMLDHWRPYFEGVKQLMACGCQNSGPRSTTPVMTVQREAGPPPPDAVMVEYTGSKVGSVTYKGESGALYSFAAGEGPKWVDGRDVALFHRLKDFRLVLDAVPTPDAPVLV